MPTYITMEGAGSGAIRRMVTNPTENAKASYEGVLAEVTTRFLAEEPEALREVMWLLGARTERVIRGRLGKMLTEADYEDAMAIALFRMWERRKRFDPSRSRLDRWFYVLARNAAIDLLRLRTRRPEDAVGHDLDQLAAPERGVPRSEYSELRHDLSRALERVSEMDRRILLSGLSENELSRELGLKPGTIRVRRFRTKEKLRSALREMGHVV